MKRSLLIPAGMAALLLGNPLLAADNGHALSESQRQTELERQTYESKGVFSGLAIGALVGGPAGAVLSAATGGWIGNKFHEARMSRTLKAELEKTMNDLARLQNANETLQQQLLASQNELQQRKLVANTGRETFTANSGCCTDSELTLHFRSASSELEAHYLPELRNFARNAKLLPEATIEISGHSDRRGENASNLALSQQRVKTVESTLRELGLGGMRFRTTARGEQQPLTDADSLEGNFFDRRVQVRLVSEPAELLTRHNP